MVQKRYFFHAPGFDPYDLASQYRRFVRETVRFTATWNVSATVSRLRERPDDDGHWSVITTAPGWRVETCYEQFEWHNIVRGELDRSGIRRLWDGAVTYADLIWSGTVFRYFGANLRYAVFCLMPLVIVLLFAALAILAGVAAASAARHVGASGLPAGAAGVGIAGVVFAVLMRWPGRRWRTDQGLADWIFAREYMLGRRPDLEARLDAFAERLIACARRADTDEIVVMGHSLGATVVVDVMARALARDPDLGRHGPQICVLTVGATIPKIALHPDGGWLREKSRRLAAEPSIAWAEYQARDDVISFHKFDPVKLKRFDDINGPTWPLIRRVQIHEMLEPATLRRFRFDYMRLHYQFVMANERRALYDFYMMMCGPVPFRRLINEPNGPVDLFAADGALVDAANGMPR